MKILFLSCFTDNDFNQMIKLGKNISQAAQKFDKLFVKGFIKNGCEVDVILFHSDDESLSEYEIYKNKRINYHICKLEGTITNRLKLRRKFIKDTFVKWHKNSQDGIVVIDALKPGALELSSIASKNDVKVVSIITDFRDLLDNKRNSVKQKIVDCLLNGAFYKQFKFTSLFVLLTEEMSNKVPVRNNAIVIEGLCDSDLCNELEDNNRKIEDCIVYSGALSKQFGIDNLVSAFMKADTANFELHLYGNGDYVEKIKEISGHNKKIEYMGTIPNEKMVEVQRKAYCLINPRPVGDEYTKYSFPSKTMEYMAAGRPVITTKLPGIPKDYDDYLIYFDDDSVRGIAAGITNILKKDEAYLSDIGMRAKKYVINKKNNVIQTRRLLDAVKEQL